MATRKVVFVAYSSKDTALSNGIFDAISKANARPLPIIYEPWVFNDVAGGPLISPILAKIDDSPFVIADITYLNLNVVYEIGFAIGRNKRAFLVRHKGTEGDQQLTKAVGIFDTLGYHEYETFDELKDRLSAHIEQTHLHFSKDLDAKFPVYIVEPSFRDESITTAISRIKKARYPYRSFNGDDDLRMSASDTTRQVSAASGVVLPFQDPAIDGAQAHNIRCMFVAGLSEGMGKPTLLPCPNSFVAPLDIKDEITPFKTPHDISSAIADFCPLIAEYASKVEPSGIDTQTLLEALSIGDPRAENEMPTLGLYYLKTDQFERTVRGEANLVVGRKGSGKTALFIQVRDKIRSDKRNIVVDLKPEGYQLVKLKEEILTYLSAGARQHLITAFWEYLILLEVAYKILEKDQNTYRHNHSLYELYVELRNTYELSDFTTEGDFSERLIKISDSLIQKYKSEFSTEDAQRLTAAQVTELLYKHDLKQLRTLISRYLQEKKSVWVLFDNLDKGWSTYGVDVIDAIVLRCLVDAGRKIEREMKRADHDFHCIVFVRNDVYDTLMKNSADYGKESRAALDWNDPDMLREMLRLRLVNGMKGKLDRYDFNTVWRELCLSHYLGEETSSYIIERSLMRPRNVLKIFNHCRGFATNFGRQKISDPDIDKGLTAYSHDLLEELDRELSDVFPGAKDLLYYFLDAPEVMSGDHLEGILREANIDEADRAKVVDFLLYYGILGTRLGETDHFIYSVNYDLKVLKIRASRHTDAADYVVNPAFWPSLGIKPVRQTIPIQ
jgi:acyl-CoA-binding protein